MSRGCRRPESHPSALSRVHESTLRRRSCRPGRAARTHQGGCHARVHANSPALRRPRAALSTASAPAAELLACPAPRPVSLGDVIMRPVRDAIFDLGPLLGEQECTELIAWSEREGFAPWPADAETPSLDRC